jgi:hypothetical protein
MSFVPGPVAGSVFSQYASGGTPSRGYSDITDAIEAVGQRIGHAKEPSLTYLYLPQYDGLVHRLGTEHEQVFGLCRQLDEELSKLASQLPKNTRMIVTADHGLVDTPDEQRFALPLEDPLFDHLMTLPSGERTTPIFHVLKGHEISFREDFCDRFGEFFALLTADEIETLGLLGPGPLSSVMRRRLGTYLGVSPSTVQLYPNSDKNKHHKLIGVHGGLSAEEMYVPVIVA